MKSKMIFWFKTAKKKLIYWFFDVMKILNIQKRDNDSIFYVPIEKIIFSDNTMVSSLYKQ